MWSFPIQSDGFGSTHWVELFNRLPSGRSNVVYLVSEGSSLPRGRRTRLHTSSASSPVHQFNKPLYLRNKKGARERSEVYLMRFPLNRKRNQEEGRNILFYIDWSSFPWITLYSLFAWVWMTPLEKGSHPQGRCAAILTSSLNCVQSSFECPLGPPVGKIDFQTQKSFEMR